ncbi:MAG: hypothetical protein Q8884_02720, partial [Sweet potato little leaf phytoplasma]|nr:hypothetical protein [Sweet potato little leaf phytoplasma]
IFLVAAIDAFIVIFEGNVIINFIQNNFKNNSKIIYKDNILTGPCMIVSFTTRHSGTEEVHSSSFILTAMPSSLRKVPEAQSIVYIKLCPRSHSNFFSFRVPGLRKTKSPSRLSTPSSTSLLQYIEAQKPPRQPLQPPPAHRSTPPTTSTLPPVTPRRTPRLPTERLRKL